MNYKKFRQPTNTNKWKNIPRVLEIIQLISLIVGMIFIVFQLRSIAHNEKLTNEQIKADNDIAATQFLLQFKDRLTSGTNNQIYTTVTNQQPILKENGGNFTIHELRQYLSFFSQLSTVTNLNIIPEEFIWSHFYDSITETYNNKEIQEYLQKIRGSDPTWYRGLDHLNKFVIDYENWTKSSKK